MGQINLIESNYKKNNVNKQMGQMVDERNIKTITLNTPMYIVQLYLSLVFVLFVLGPWPWPVHNKVIIYLYLIFAQVLLFLGFKVSMKRKKSIPRISGGNNLTKEHLVKVRKIIKISLFISLTLMIPNYLARVGSDGFSIINFVSSLADGINNPGGQYHNKLNLAQDSIDRPLLLLMTIVTAPYTWLLFPLTIIYWKDIKKRYKFGTIIVVFVDFASWVSIGTNKGVFDIVFILIFSILLKMGLEGRLSSQLYQLSKKRVRIFFFSGVLLTTVLTYFTGAIKSRSGLINTYDQAARIHVDFDSFVMRIVPNFMKEMIIAISSYTTQGYYGLSLAMGERFSFTYGFGNSWFLMSLFEKITHRTELPMMTYPFKIEKYGWDPYVNWHSIYTWLASDFTFVGSLFVVFIIGYIFGEVWKSCLIQRNIFGMGLFILFMIMFMYFPANNQIFAFVQTFSAFWGLFFIWFFTVKIKITKEK